MAYAFALPTADTFWTVDILRYFHTHWTDFLTGTTMIAAGSVHFLSLIHILNCPDEIWITDTTFRDGQQARAPYTVDQIVTLYLSLIHI